MIKKFLWIDSSLNSKENILNLKYLKEEYPDSIIITKNSLQKGFDYLMSKKFRFIYLIISGRLFQDFIMMYKNNINKISCIPITCIYTSKKFKLILEKKIPFNENFLNIETFFYVKHSFYNPGGVFDNMNDIINFFKYCNNKLYYDNSQIFNNNKLNDNSIFKNYNYLNLYSFEKINNIEDLIFPFFIYKHLDDEVDKKHLNNFFKLLTQTYNDNKKINKLFKPLQNLNDIPDIISLKFLLHIYTLNSKFYKDLNYSLLVENYDIFEPMLLLLNKSIKKQLLPKNINDNLYRCCSLNKKEFLKLNEIFLNKKDGLPYGYLYSKTILSFSKNYQSAYQFMEIQDFNENLIPVTIQIIRNNIIYDESNILNIDLKDISYFEDESEVIFLPYSFFTLEKIENTSFKIGDKIKNGNIITLDYCFKYKDIISYLIKDKLIEDIINKILINNYVKDFLKYKLIHKFTKENLILFIKDNFKYNINIDIEINKYFKDLSINNEVKNIKENYNDKDINKNNQIILLDDLDFPEVESNEIKIEKKIEDYHKNDFDYNENILLN